LSQLATFVTFDSDRIEASGATEEKQVMSPAARNQNAQRSPEETGPPLCCIDCFSHPWLRQFVQENSTERGRCDYCGQEDAEVISVATLHDPFNNVVSLYVPSDDIHGDALIDLIQGEYGIFDEDLYLSEDAVALLEDIMAIGWDDDSGEPFVRAHDLYHSRSSVWSHTTMAESWQEFCDEVKENPNREPDFPVLMTEDIGRMVTVVPGGTLLYRARPGFVGEAHAIRPYQGKRELKEIHGVARAGTNVLVNIERAIEFAIEAASIERGSDPRFLYVPGSRPRIFRVPDAGVTRPLALVPPDEIRLAILYVVEDQFGCMREVLPRAVAALFAVERVREGVAELVGSVVNELIDEGTLRVSGLHVYLA
jgi:hypothetical protein